MMVARHRAKFPQPALITRSLLSMISFTCELLFVGGSETANDTNVNLDLVALMDYSGLMMFGAMTLRQIFGLS